tara:strand:+ start:179 stop:484 length:306 start_codon:yes stop_codon:yes gene_type:complete
MAKRYDPFPNRITEVNAWDATDELTQFNSDMCLGAADNWNLPESHVAIIRAYLKNGTIRERAYKQPKSAHKFMISLLKNKEDFTIMTYDQLQDTLPEDAFD